jgi:WD40 repeat protein
MTLKEDGASVNTVGFSPDGLLLASGGDDRTVRLWEVSTGLSLRRLSGHRGSIANVAFSNDGQLVASVGGALNTEDSGRFGEVKIWDTQTGDPVCDLGSHDAGVRSVAFAPRSGLIATGDLDGMLRLWDLRVAEQRWALKTESPVFSIAFSPDGESLAVGGSYSRRVQLYDPITGSPKAVDSSN